jgi:hypothetical protein
MNGTKKDIIILVADIGMEAAVRGILSRPHSLGIGNVEADIYRHPQKDPGCRTDGVSFLDPFSNQYEHALLIFDFTGCGDESTPAYEQEESLKKSMDGTWGEGGAEVVIIEPELDVWVWSDSPHVDNVIGWRGRHPALRPWLQEKGFLAPGSAKPEQPKEALGAALRLVKKPRSSSIYFELAQRVSLERCDDQAFLRLKAILKRWFRR